MSPSIPFFRPYLIVGQDPDGRKFHRSFKDEATRDKVLKDLVAMGYTVSPVDKKAA
jgi:hypothetical protein